VLLALACSSAPKADTVHLKDGRALQLDDCRQEGAELKCRRAGGVIGIPLSQVEKVEKDPQGPTRSSPAARGTRPLAAASTGTPALDPLPPDADLPAGTSGGLSPAVAQARIETLLPIVTGLAKPGTDRAAARREIAVLYAFLGNAAMLRKDYEQGTAHYNSALEYDPALLVARLNLCTALINLKSYQGAEEALRQVLAAHPGEARALELMGEAAFQQGRNEEAIDLWEKAIESNPKEKLQARLDRARRLLKAEEGFHRSDASHFSLKFDGQEASPELAQEILSCLEESWSDLAVRFAHYPEAVIQVTLYSNRVFYDATEAPSWAGGVFDGQMRIPIRGLTHLTPRARQVLVHELTHSFIADKAHDNAPDWIQEGMAQIMEGRGRPADRAALARECGGQEAVACGKEFSYPKSLSQMEFFVDAWSTSHVNDLLDQLARGADIDTALRAAIGLSHEEFLQAWGEWLSR
jgi:tetratricopeptide (TPR) repeat protein